MVHRRRHYFNTCFHINWTWGYYSRCRNNCSDTHRLRAVCLCFSRRSAILPKQMLKKLILKKGVVSIIRNYTFPKLLKCMLVELINTSQLKQVFKFTNLWKYPKDFELKIIGLSEIENSHYSENIKRHSVKCGCDTGRMFLLSFLFGYIGFVAAYSLQLPLKNYIVNCLFLSLLGAITGKAYGLILASWKISKIIKEIEQKIDK